MEEKELSAMQETINTIFNGVSGLVNTKKVIGEPYTIGDTTIIPFIETSMGMGVGSFSSTKQAGGMGCKVTPLACLVIQNGFTKLINIKNQDSISKALDLIPDLVDKLTNKPKISKEVKESIDNLQN